MRRVLIVIALLVSACGHAESAPAPAVPPSSSAAPSCPDTGFDCDMQTRIAAVEKYAASRPGIVGIVLRDRRTGAVWRNAHADEMVWTASTIKLAMVVNLFERNSSGKITLSVSDRKLIEAMLHSSDDHAADTLWQRYSGPTFNAAFPAYGMTSLVPQRGYSSTFPYWGFEKCTANDLDRLITYVLDKAPERAYILEQMRGVGPEQQWGVWRAGAGAKNGWSEEDGGWVMNSVGFAGEGERYTLAIMNNLAGKGGYDEGRATDTEIARILLEGRI